MAFIFRKSLKIAPGIKINLGKKSLGVSVGVKGAHIGMNSSKGLYSNVRIPGTGISSINYHNKGSDDLKMENNTIATTDSPVSAHMNKSFGVSFLLLILGSLIAFWIHFLLGIIAIILSILIYKYCLKKQQ